MKNRFIKLTIGLIAGFLNGVFGSGGGTVIVPSLEKFLGVEEHKAHATAIAIILPLSILSGIVYLKGGGVDWSLTFWVISGGVLGGYIGAKWLGKFSKNLLHEVFGMFLIIAAVRMIL